METRAKILAEALFLASRGKTAKAKEKIAENLIKFLKIKKETYLLPEILINYQRYLKRKMGLLIFAREMEKDIQEKLKEICKGVLKEAEAIELRIDKGIIGGFIVKTENFLIDASIKGFLERIKGRIITGN